MSIYTRLTCLLCINLLFLGTKDRKDQCCNNNYLLTESEIFAEKSHLRLCCIDRAIARSIQPGWNFSIKIERSRFSKSFIIRHLFCPRWFRRKWLLHIRLGTRLIRLASVEICSVLFPSPQNYLAKWNSEYSVKKMPLFCWDVSMTVTSIEMEIKGEFLSLWFQLERMKSYQHESYQESKQTSCYKRPLGGTKCSVFIVTFNHSSAPGSSSVFLELFLLGYWRF